MRIYLAARYSMRETLKRYRNHLQALGHTVTSTWLDTEWPLGEERGRSSTAPPEYRQEWADKDLADVRQSELVINFSCDQQGRGGRHVEFGYALALRIPQILIGPPEHLFHEHRDVLRLNSWEEFMAFEANAMLGDHPLCGTTRWSEFQPPSA